VPARGRAHEQPLHLAGAAVEPAKRDAPRELAVDAGCEQSPLGPRVVAGKACNLRGEALVGEVDAECLRVLEEQDAGVVRVGVLDRQLGYRSSSDTGSGAVVSPPARARSRAEKSRPRAGSSGANAPNPRGFSIES